MAAKLSSPEFHDLLTRYPNAESIAEGGQKSVYRIILEDDRPAVLKLVSVDAPNALKRIFREFDILRQLEGQHFPRVYELTQVSDTALYFTEELIDSPTLERQFDQIRQRSILDRIALELSSICMTLWAAGIIHRDIKPGNLLFSDQRGLTLLDFGIARVQGEESFTFTMAPHGPGTPVYAAPEQINNRKREINHRCDQFAVGVVLAQIILGGEHPFAPDLVGSGDSIIANIQANQWARERVKPAVPREIFKTIERLVEAKPHRRYRRPEDFQAAMHEAFAEEVSP